MTTALRSALRRLYERATRNRDSRAERSRILALLATTPTFDRAFYLEQNPDVAQAGIDPLTHYVGFGASEGRDPHALFDSSFYLERNPDVARAGLNPLAHYLRFGAFEGRDPHPLFNSSFYLEQNPDVARARINPLVHYLSAGAAEGRDPHPLFDSSFYLEHNRDVALSKVNPLVHYVSLGYRQGRAPRTSRPPRASVRIGYRRPSGLWPSFSPLNLEVRDELTLAPRLNVLLPSLILTQVSGKQGTAFCLACHVAAAGMPVRLVSTDSPPDFGSSVGHPHLGRLSAIDAARLDVQVVDASNRHRPTAIGGNDVFLATAWWTAPLADHAVQETSISRFLYLIQDLEAPHPASSGYTFALETYGLDYVPIVESSLLRDHLAQAKVGRFAEEAFSEDAIVFEPVLDGRYLFPETQLRMGDLRLSASGDEALARVLPRILDGLADVALGRRRPHEDP